MKWCHPLFGNQTSCCHHCCLENTRQDISRKKEDKTPHETNVHVQPDVSAVSSKDTHPRRFHRCKYSQKPHSVLITCLGVHWWYLCCEGCFKLLILHQNWQGSLGIRTPFDKMLHKLWVKKFIIWLLQTGKSWGRKIKRQRGDMIHSESQALCTQWLSKRFHADSGSLLLPE